jgi:hypothetical protein
VHAFDELAMLVFIELLEETGRYDDALDRADDEAHETLGEDDEEDRNEEEEGREAEEEPDARAHAELAEGYVGEPTLWQRTRDLALAAGFMVRAKTDGWKLFCERMNVPPFLFWERLPGFDRLQLALALAEEAAFFPEGMLRWLNAIRQERKPEATVGDPQERGWAGHTVLLRSALSARDQSGQTGLRIRDGRGRPRRIAGGALEN